MSEKHQMPGYRPSALGLATKVRIGEPGIEMSAYSVVTIIFLLEESLAKMHAPVNRSPKSKPMVSLGSLKISLPRFATVLIFFTAGLLSLVIRARRLTGSVSHPAQTGLLISSD